MYQLALRSFDLKPREVVEYLDRFIIQRYDTKKILAVAICDHYNHCRRCLDEERSIEESKRRRKNKNNNKEQDDEEDEDFDDDWEDLFAEPETRSEYAKPNILLAGPTGVGKTYLLKNPIGGCTLCQGRCNEIKWNWYIVGRDAEDLVRDLVDAANGNPALASMGIIYVDENDKMAGGGNEALEIRGGGSFNTKSVLNSF